MLQDMFGSFSNGAIGRGRFILLTLLLLVLFIAIGMSLGVGAAIADRTGISAHDRAIPVLGFTGFAIFLAAVIAYIVGSLNLVAKRARDIGWSPLLLIILFVFFSGVTWIVLAVMPRNPQPAAA